MRKFNKRVKFADVKMGSRQGLNKSSPQTKKIASQM